MPQDPEPDITIREAAARKGVSPKTIRKLIETGELPARRLGSRLIRIRPEDVDRLGRDVTSGDLERLS
ncbi:helix-turn-helix domain-containing protein [Nocardioides sp. KR10-350]|uniref:helix-turn-helix domain-containing protein n=1 Tax=Nocardioides cheoyonin TaxID=3156615 RepID=UPI0032B482DC